MVHMGRLFRLSRVAALSAERLDIATTHRGRRSLLIVKTFLAKQRTRVVQGLIITARDIRDRMRLSKAHQAGAAMRSPHGR